MGESGKALGGQVIVDGAKEGQRSTAKGEQIIGIGLLMRRHVFLHVEHAEGGLEVGAVVELPLELLAGLLLIQRYQYVAQLELRGVDIDEGMGFQTAMAGDALEQPALAQIPLHRHRQALVLEILALIGCERGAGEVVEIAGSRRQQLHDAQCQIGLPQLCHRTAHAQRRILLGVIESKRGTEGIAGLVGQLGANGAGVVVVVVFARDAIFDVAVMRQPRTGHAGGQGVAELAAGIDAPFGTAMIAGGQLECAAFVVERVLGGELDRTASGVLAVERALRAAQHFHLLHVEQREQRAVDARVVDVVHVHADARIERLQGVGLADAADEHVDAVGRTTALHDVEVGHGTLQTIDGGGLLFREIGFGEGAHRDRHVEDRLLAPACSHHHVVQALRVFIACRRRSVRRLGLRLRGNAQQHADGHTQMGAFHCEPSFIVVVDGPDGRFSCAAHGGQSTRARHLYLRTVGRCGMASSHSPPENDCGLSPWLS